MGVLISGYWGGAASIICGSWEGKLINCLPGGEVNSNKRKMSLSDVIIKGQKRNCTIHVKSGRRGCFISTCGLQGISRTGGLWVGKIKRFKSK